MKHDSDTTLTLMAEFGRQLRTQMRGDTTCPSISQLEALQFVSEHTSPTMRDLASYLKVKAPSATSLINELARARMISRHGDPNDRRQVRLALTQKGEKELVRISQKKRQIIGSMLRSLSPKDRETLNGLLQKVLAEK